MTARTLVLGATLALLVPATPALAGARAAGGLMAKTTGDPQYLGEFAFDPRGERVSVYDANPDNWDVLVELWWGGKLRRWCWNTKGYQRTQNCDFEIPEGRRISFFIAEFDYTRWARCAPSSGCGKRRHHWAGPDGDDGCRAVRFRPPCAFTARTVHGENDFTGRS